MTSISSVDVDELFYGCSNAIVFQILQSYANFSISRISSSINSKNDFVLLYATNAIAIHNTNKPNEIGTLNKTKTETLCN